MTRPTCTYDTGSMYGNAPACDRPADVIVTQARSGGYGPFTSPVCKRHQAATENRAYPTPTTTAPIGA